MPTTGTSSAKSRLRSRIRRALERVPSERRTEAGIAIERRLRARKEWRMADEIVAFASAGMEVDTDPLLTSALAEGKTVLLPRIAGQDRLEFAPISSIEALVPGPFGIREPDPRQASRPVSTKALFVIPGLAFDRGGGRLGRGAGYYDRALAPILAAGGGAIMIGLGFDLQLVEKVPMSPLDVRLDGVVTEKTFFLSE